MGNKFGWHSGTLTCKDGKFLGDVYIQDDIVFSDVSAGTLGVTGGIDMTRTVSAIGINMSGGTFSDSAIKITGVNGQGIYINKTASNGPTVKAHCHQLAATTDAIANEFKGEFLSTSSTMDGIGSHFHMAASGTGILRAVLGVAYLDSGVTLTGTDYTANGWVNGGMFVADVAGTIAGNQNVIAGLYAGISSCQTGTLTACKYMTSLYVASNRLATLSAGQSSLILATNDAGTDKKVVDYGLRVENGANMLTTGISLSGPMTTGLDVSGATTEAINITGSSTRAINIDTGTIGTGVTIGGTLTNGVSVGACTTAYATTGAVVTGYNLAGNATDGFKVSSGTVANGFNVAGGTVTTGLAIGASVYGISITVASTTGISLTSVSTTGIDIQGTMGTGITIGSGSLTDGIKISATTPVDGLEISSACSAVGLNLSGANLLGIDIAGSTTGISIGAATTGIAIAGIGATVSARALSTVGWTLNNANLTDGYGTVECDLTLTGATAGHNACLSSWINANTGTLSSLNIIAAQTNGLYVAEAVTRTGSKLVGGMRMSLLVGNPNAGITGGETHYWFSVNTQNNGITAIFDCATNSDLGVVANAGTALSELVPFSRDAGGNMRYVKLYTLV